MAASISRSDSIKAICNYEVEQLIRVSIEHVALSIIAGISMDGVSQKEWESMGGSGQKPKPLSEKVKNEMYSNIKNYLKTKILTKVSEFVIASISKSTALSDIELAQKVVDLQKKPTISEPNWKVLPDLIKDHLCTFKELQKTSFLKADIASFHDVICPILRHYRDSDELFKKTQLNELSK